MTICERRERRRPAGKVQLRCAKHVQSTAMLIDTMRAARGIHLTASTRRTRLERAKRNPAAPTTANLVVSLLRTLTGTWAGTRIQLLDGCGSASDGCTNKHVSGRLFEYGAF